MHCEEILKRKSVNSSWLAGHLIRIYCFSLDVNAARQAFRAQNQVIPKFTAGKRLNGLLSGCGYLHGRRGGGVEEEEERLAGDVLISIRDIWWLWTLSCRFTSVTKKK